MCIRQVSVYVENRCGRLQEITEILSNAAVNIIAHALLDTRDFGVLRMIVDRPETAVEILKTQGFVVNTNDVVAVLVEDRPGGFNRLLALLSDHQINFNYTYSIGHTAEKRAVNIIHFDEPERAVEVLTAGGVTVAGNGELAAFWPAP